MKPRRIGPGPDGPVFLPPARTDHDGVVHLVFQTSSPPGSPSFGTAIETAVERLSEKLAFWVLTFPEEGDVPLTPGSFAKVHASFADGRWYTELKPRARIADLRRNRDLTYTLFLQNEGALLAVDRDLGHTATSLARLLDGAPDQGTMAYLLEHVVFVAWTLDIEIHLKSRRPQLVSWIQKRLP